MADTKAKASTAKVAKDGKVAMIMKGVTRRFPQVDVKAKKTEGWKEK